MAIEIRKANTSDAKAAWDIRTKAILHQCVGHYSDDSLQTWTKGEPTEHFARAVANHWHVAITEETIVGTGAIDIVKGHLDAIFVHPDMMGRRIGTQMMNYLEQIARDFKIAKLTLDSTLNAAPFYRHLGFVGDQFSTYESPRGISLACIPMQKLILPASAA